MFRALLTTTALAALMTAGVIAQDQNANPPPADQQQQQQQQPADPNAQQQPAPADQQQQEQQAQQQSQQVEQQNQQNQTEVQSLLAKGYQVVDEDSLATELIGMAVYSGPNDDAERIGDVNNFVITDQGQVAAVIIGVGGFLGIGEKNVAVDYRELQRTTDQNGDLRLVLPTTKDALTSAPDFKTVDNKDANQQDLAGKQAQQAQNQQLAQPADQNDQQAQPADQNQQQAQPADQNQQQAQPADQANQQQAVANPPPDRSQLTVATLTAEELIGTNAYGPNNEHLGTIGDMVLGEDGKTIEAVVIDFGGFLGIGKKEVAVSMENLQFYTDQNGNRYVFINVTREQLDQAQDFDKNSFAQNRQAQLLVTQPAPGGQAAPPPADPNQQQPAQPAK